MKRSTAVFKPAPTKHPHLDSTDVHVWRADLNLEENLVSYVKQHLSEEERQRASRFHFKRHRRRYIIARGILRDLLGRYLDKAPERIQLDLTRFGKPYIDGDSLQFNVAHSGELAILAFTRDRFVGVDIERIRPFTDAGKFVDRYFSAGEQDEYRRLPEDQKPEAFFNCWTRKEAYIKAVGEGLSHPLNTFDVSMEPGQPARLLHVGGDEKEAAKWTLVAFSPGTGYAAALAVQGTALNIDFWSLIDNGLNWSLEC